jgi:LPS export ABC transporter protein LptC
VLGASGGRINFKSMHRSYITRFVFSVQVISLIFFLASCNKSDVKKAEEYTGPLSEAENVELYYSETDQVKIKMMADLVHEFKNGDREFPKGIYLEFYDELGKIKSTLRANEAYFFKAENQWRGRGKVEVKNIASDEQLTTEELFWKPADEKIFTEKFVTIRQATDIVYGTGLEAKQDMSSYTLKQQISADMELKDEE